MSDKANNGIISRGIVLLATSSAHSNRSSLMQANTAPDLSARQDRSRSFRRLVVPSWLLRTTSALALAEAVMVMTTDPAAAQTWTGATSTDWTNAANWTGGVPTNGAVIINTPSNPAVLGVNGAATGTTGDFSLSTAGGLGSLTIQNGSTLTTSPSGYVFIGRNAGSTGVLNVTGAGSTWNINGVANSLILGQIPIGTGTAPTGTLNISNGGTVNTGGDIVVGETRASGVLSVTSGGKLTTGRDAYIGRFIGSDGTATITGTGSSWAIANRLFIGNGGPGALTISNNAMVDVGTSTTVGDSASQGTLNVTSGGVLQTQTLVRGTGPVQVNFDGGTLRAKTNTTSFVSGFSGTELNIASGGLTVDTAGFNVTASSPFSGAGTFTKIGVGTLTLTGANSTNFSGVMAINKGTLSVGAATNLGTGGLSFDGGTLQNTGAFTTALPVTLNAGGGTFQTDAGLTLGGIIGGTGALTKTGASALTLTGADTYSGQTWIQSGTLALSGSGAIANSSRVVADGTFDISAVTPTGASIQSLAGAGSVALGAKTLTLTNANDTFAGAITGTGGLTVSAGTQTLTGSSNYTGITSVTGTGNLQLLNGGKITGTSSTTLDGANAVVTATVSGAGSLLQTGTLTLAPNAGSDVTLNVLNGGAVTRTSIGTTLIGGPGGSATVNVDGAGSSLNLAGALNVSSSNTATNGFLNITNGGVVQSAGGSVGTFLPATGTKSVVISGAGSRWTANGAFNLQSNASVSILNGGAASAITSIVGTSGNGGTANLLVSGAGSTYSVTGNQVVGATSGKGFITLADGAVMSVGGQLTLASTATATGVLNIGGAEGQAATGAGTLTTSKLVFGSGTGRVNFNHTDPAYVFSTVMSGGGVVNQTGPGTTILTADNTYTGGTAISAGTLQLGNGGTTGSIVGNVADNGALAFNRSDTYTFSGLISGAGAVSQIGSGTTILTADNTYTGPTTISAGTLQLGNGGAAGSIVGNVTNNGALAFNRSDTYSFGGLISGSGALNQIGSGTTVLTGNNSYTGATTISAGTLIVNGDQSAATGPTSVASGATLGGNGIIGGSVAVANGGTLSPGNAGNVPGTLMIQNDLVLNGGSVLNYNFGQANVAGGPLNDLTKVNGNLTLAGTLNVNTSPGGSFDPGVYRVISYAGTLTNNGLAVGAIPSPDYYVQTSIANQVNLVNTTGVTLNFWDGAAGPKNNGVINGGDGVWQNAAGNDNWTTADGTINAPYSNGAFAVFAGAPGTVTVDNSLGQVSASGMQFAANGYHLVGGAIALNGAPTIIRIGDGTAAGAGYVATIDNVLTGNSQLVKADLGTLVLNGVNTYTGGTTVTGGTLSISSDANLGAAGTALTLDTGTLQTTASMTTSRNVAVPTTGSFLTNAGTTLTLNGTISGAGGVVKAGGGTLLLNGVAANTGSTTIAGGTLRTGASNVLSSASSFSILSGATLDLNGHDQTVASLGNAGTVKLGAAPGTALTVTGNYTGNGGVLALNTTLGSDASATDRLHVRGSTSGTTSVKVTNVGGLGAQTVEGIKIIDVAGASNGTFSLLGDYVFQGQQALVGGAYAYTLQKNGISTPTDGDWYLRSSLTNPPDSGSTPPAAPAGPLYQPGVPLYENYAQVLLGMNEAPSLQQRVGNRYWGGGPSEAMARMTVTPAAEADRAAAQSAFWGRIEGGQANLQPSNTTGSTYNADQMKAQAGLDGLALENAYGRLIVGLTAQYGLTTAYVNSFFGNGTIRASGSGVGATATWYGDNGFYVDGQAQTMFYRADLSSALTGSMTHGNEGFGYAFSVEGGKRIGVGNGFWLTPQAQLAYSKVDFDPFVDRFGAQVSLGNADSLLGRVGLALNHQRTWNDGSGIVRSDVYAIGNLHYEFLNGSRVDVAGTNFASANDRLWAASAAVAPIAGRAAATRCMARSATAPASTIPLRTTATRAPAASA